MDRTCCTYGGEERCIQDFGGGTLRERGNFEDIRVDGRIILKCLQEIG